MSWTRWQATCSTCGRSVPGGGAAIDHGPPPRAFCATCWAEGDDNPLQDRDGLPAQLYQYQRDGVAWLAPRRAGLLADEPGLGKTAQALCALAARRAPPAVAVVVPSTRRQWGREVRRWAPGYRFRLQEGNGAWHAPHPGELLILGYPALRAQAERAVQPRTVVVLDEAQWVKNPQAQQTRGVRALAGAALEAGGAVWLLTATPAYASAEECWEVLRAANLHRALHPSQQSWVEATPAPEQADRLAAVMLRRRAQDVLDLPPLRVVTEAVEIAAEAARGLDRAAAEAVAVARWRAQHPGEEPSNEILFGLALTADEIPGAEVKAAVEQLLQEETDVPLATVRRLVALAKLPRAQEIAEELRASACSLLALCDHRTPVLALAGLPGWGAVVGGQGARERDDQVNAFAEGRLLGLAVTYASGGTGLDGLQRVCARALLLDLPWTPAVLEQSLGRLVRVGQVGASVLATILVADHWVDELLLACAQRKLGALEGLGIGLSLAEASRIAAAASGRASGRCVGDRLQAVAF